MHNASNRPSRSGSSVRRDGARKPYQSRETGHSFQRTPSSHASQTSRSSERSPRSSFSRKPESQNEYRSAPRSGGNRPRSFSDRPSFSHRPPVARGKRVQKTFDVSKFINKNPVTNTETEVFVPKHKFTEFGLDKKLAFTITESGLISPTPIQDEIIPYILEGRDVIGLANTGTGKTAAFLIPLIDKTLREYSKQTLILTPTRELAIQIETELRKLSAGFKLFSTTCVGGTNIRPQIQGLKRKNHFIIGTPGRVLDLIERRSLRPDTITTVVLDEADRMLDMGFIHDMRQILSGVRKDRETLFFSATMGDDIKKLVHDFLRDPITISVKKQDITHSVEQDVVKYGHSDKFETLTRLLGDMSFKRVLIFGAMKHSVEKLSQQLVAHGITADSIHGNKSHPQRQRSLKNFKDSRVRVLVATDVAARGIHVDNVTHVINYDLPATYEDYVHRIGRTGRGAEKGKALTFIQ